jgi:hypothetical protein
MGSDWVEGMYRVTQEEAEEKLRRSLSEPEVQALRNIASMLHLELWQRDLAATRSAEEAEGWAAELARLHGA